MATPTNTNRLRPPDTGQDGEPLNPYLADALRRSTIEDATATENISGVTSLATPLGLTELTNELNALKAQVAGLTNDPASSILTGSSPVTVGATSATVAFAQTPQSVVSATPVGVPLDGIYATISGSSVVVTWTAGAPSAGSVSVSVRV